MAEQLTYGFVDYAHAVEEQITTIGEQATYDAIVESARFHSEHIGKIFSMFCSEGTTWQELVKIAASSDLQPVTDITQPDPVRYLGQYTQGYPIQKAGIAFGLDRVSKNSMSIGDANRQTLQMLKADHKWLKRHVLASLFHKTAWTFTDKLHGALTINPLANGDSVLYNKADGSTATANHYLGFANTIDDGSDNPFPTIEALLHAYESQEGLDIMTYVAANLVATVQALTNYVAVGDPRIALGISSDTIAGGIPDPGPGREVIGRVDKQWIATWSDIPDSYMLSVVMGASDPIVRQRNMSAANLQGFFPERADVDGNLSKLSLIRYAGFGVRNRLGAVASYIGNSTYANPSAYSAMPLAG